SALCLTQPHVGLRRLVVDPPPASGDVVWRRAGEGAVRGADGMACKRSGVQVSSAAAGQWPVEDRGGMAASSQVAGMPQVMRVAPTEMGRVILACASPCRTAA